MNLDKKKLRNLSFLYPEVLEILLSIKASMIKYDTNLNDLYKKYDPN